MTALLEISDKIKTQDNRCTPYPLFVVFQKREIVTHEDYNDCRVSWFTDDSVEADQETVERLNNIYSDTSSDNAYSDEISIENSDGDYDTWYRLAIMEIDEFVTACFTEFGAEEYIRLNNHNLKKPYIYAESLFRNHEMLSIRDYILENF